jgi:hypothetical protein
MIRKEKTSLMRALFTFAVIVTVCELAMFAIAGIVVLLRAFG